MRTREQCQQELNLVAMMYGDRAHAISKLQPELDALGKRLDQLKAEFQQFPPQEVPGPAPEPKKNEAESKASAPASSDQPA